VDFLVGLGRDCLAGFVERFTLQVLKFLHGFVCSCLHFAFTILKVSKLGFSLLFLGRKLSLFLLDLLLVLLALLDQEQVLFLQIFKNAHQIVRVLKWHFKLVVRIFEHLAQLLLNVEVVNHTATFKIVFNRMQIFVFLRPTHNPSPVKLCFSLSFLMEALILLGCGTFLFSLFNNFTLALRDQIV
jgi:hypothetical protein